MNDTLRIWREIGRLQGQVEVLREEVAKLRAERAPVIDHEPKSARETDGNLICLPGVKLGDLRPDGRGRSRGGRRRP